uniref:hypothetical protein n=1 Tax=Niallia taxi TaxID=2499688 RepID=UPI003F495C33
MLNLTPLITNAEEISPSESYIDLVTIQSMYLPGDLEGASEVIEMYESNGWIYEDNHLVRKINAQDLTAYVDGEELATEENETSLVVPMEEDKEKTVEFSFLDDEADSEEIELVQGETTTIVKYVDLDKEIETMASEEEFLDEGMTTSEYASASSDVDGHVAAKGLKNGEKPKNGQAIHCNRFNGYLGDGKYYDKKDHPVLAAKNFFQSDCDVSLGNYTYCLKDYTASTKCALSPSSKNGWCSTLSKVGHSKNYHKHTGWFSPKS